MNNVEPGKKIELTYPDKTLVEAIEGLRKRRVQVIRVRDLMEEPLTPAEFLQRPLVRRSRWLIMGFDLDAEEYRQFYLGTSAEYHAPGVLKVALYEPGGKRPLYAISEPFGPTHKERRLMAKAVASWSQRDLEGLELRIYSDDLRMIG